MQFHLHGYKTGNPELSEADERAKPRVPDGVSALPDVVDVLIVGCGPAGLTLAAQLAILPDIKVCVVEQKLGPLELGQADGVACRTMEMFNAFGFADRLLREAYWVNETTFWKPADDTTAGIVRAGRIKDTEEGLSEFPHVILNQARVHQFYLDVMAQSASRLTPHYGLRLVDVHRDLENSGDAGGDYPVTIRLEDVDGGRANTVRARYVVGCDGARSGVRRAIGQTLKGDAAHQVWGVMDVLAVTDFPDIRYKAIINSAQNGSVVLIPREGGYLVRIYVEMDKLDEDERVADRGVTLEDVIAAAQKVFHPYSLDIKQLAWWSAYEIGQRLCDRFDDLAAEDDDLGPRIFIAGDACHTHSPKAGQGMNVSMQDAFNLGWKLASVLQGRSTPDLLRTYNTERQRVAGELIDFDREWAAMLSTPLKTAQNPDGVDPVEVKDYFVRSGRYTAGTATRYTPSLITGPSTHQHLAKGFPIGMRFHSAPVVRLADAKLMQLGHTAQADGRWRLYAFSGTDGPTVPDSGVAVLCRFLAHSASSPIKKYLLAGADTDLIIDLRAIIQQPHTDVELSGMPEILLPKKGPLALVDYEKIFCSPCQTDEDIFDTRQIDRQSGCIVVVRPDQYVAHVLPLDDHVALSDFFGRFMLDQV